jgi:poly(3-hydroxybutyrate) depolymerase
MRNQLANLASRSLPSLTFPLLLCLIPTLYCHGEPAGKKSKGVTVLRDIEYARVGDLSLKLDLYLPTGTDRKPHLVVSFHGGSWRGGSKKICHVGWLRHHGYAVASAEA